MIDFPDHFLFFSFFCTLKYANMIRISNHSFFRFCWENEKLDWPKCARTDFPFSNIQKLRCLLENNLKSLRLLPAKVGLAFYVLVDVH